MKDPDRRLAVVVGLWGAWLAWALTGPGLLAIINWDQGAYIAKACAPGGHWSDAPWNAHYAIGHVYELGRYLTTALGGTIIDGYRLMTAIAFGLTAALLCDGARRLAGDRWLGALCAIVWATSWVNLLFLYTLEDNVLYLPAAAGVFWLIVARRDAWTTRESLWAGVLAGWAALQSWQALYYVGPAGYAALWLARGGMRGKLREGVAVVVGFFATLLGWCVLVAVTSHLTLMDLLRSMFSRPQGSFGLNTPAWGLWTRIIGLGAGWTATHTFVDAPAVKTPVETLGAWVLLVIVAAFVAATWGAWRARRWDLHVLALTLLVLTLVTPLYHDNTEWRYLVRFDFWPILGVLLLAALLGWVRQFAAPWTVAAAVLLSLLVAWNVVGGEEWAQRTRRSHATLTDWTGRTHQDPAFYGRDGLPWFEFFRDVHQVAPHACRYVLALGETIEGWWNPDLTGSMFSELRGGPVVLVGEPSWVGRSRYYQPQVVRPDDAVKRKLVGQGCEWISRDASRLLGWRY
jgi:hypothetical protein